MPEMNILPCLKKKAHSPVKFIYMSCSLIGSVFIVERRWPLIITMAARHSCSVCS